MANDVIPTTGSDSANLTQQLASNTDHMHRLVEQQYNLEVTRSVALFFSCVGEDCAGRLAKALFAKGTRLLDHDPKLENGRYRIRAGVKRSLRDTVREDFTRDLVETANGMNGTYDGWDLLTDESAEEVQSKAA